MTLERGLCELNNVCAKESGTFRGRVFRLGCFPSPMRTTVHVSVCKMQCNCDCCVSDLAPSLSSSLCGKDLRLVCAVAWLHPEEAV